MKLVGWRGFQHNELFLNTSLKVEKYTKTKIVPQKLYSFRFWKQQQKTSFLSPVFLWNRNKNKHIYIYVYIIFKSILRYKCCHSPFRKDVFSDTASSLRSDIIYEDKPHLAIFAGWKMPRFWDVEWYMKHQVWDVKLWSVLLWWSDLIYWFDFPGLRRMFESLVWFWGYLLFRGYELIVGKLYIHWKVFDFGRNPNLFESP